MYLRRGGTLDSRITVCDAIDQLDSSLGNHTREVAAPWIRWIPHWRPDAEGFGRRNLPGT
jgi:hypothetical protein